MYSTASCTVAGLDAPGTDVATALDVSGTGAYTYAALP